jgi:hypothetical protein
MTNFNDVKLFGDTSLADVFQQIHKNNKKIDKQIENLVTVLKPLVTSAGEAVMVMPVVKDLIDVNVKNNDQLVKMAGIAQRAVSSNGSSPDSLIDPEELQALVEEHKATQESTTKLLEQGNTIKGQIEG